MRRDKFVLLCWLCVCRLGLGQEPAGEPFSAGPLFERFPLTLSTGWREEAAGPLFSHQVTGSEEQHIVVPPLFSLTRDATAESTELDILYPLLTLDRFGSQYRFQFLQWFSFAGGESVDQGDRKRFTLFPLYFQQRSLLHPEENYTAFFPVYGQLQNRLFRREIDFVLWPLYVKTHRKGSDEALDPEAFLQPGMYYIRARRGDVVTYNFVAPLFHLRYGEALKGWQFWPLAGSEHKDVVTVTNSWGDPVLSPGHDKLFVLWPLFFKETTSLGTSNPQTNLMVLPLYTRLRSPERDATSYLWPLGLTITDDRARKYREIDAPWPLVVWARGEGKTTTRFWPFYSTASNATLRTSFYLWPLYRHSHIRSDPLDRERSRILFFLYSDLTERNLATATTRRRTDLWPLFTAQRNPDGSERFQMLALLEPFLPASKSIERNYSPVWSVWRSERSPATGAASQSFLWNLYRRETTPQGRKCSLLFGLFQYQSKPEGKSWRLFYLPVKKAGRPAAVPDPAAR